MNLKYLAMLSALAWLSVNAADAQNYQPSGPTQGGMAQQGGGQASTGNPFSFQGDQIQPLPDPQRRVNPKDPRYTQTQQLQQSGELPKPGGGCLRYGAVGAAGGHLAGHGVLGAVAGCATGMYVRHRDKARIQQQQQLTQ
jgi:hypothetical protein